jgi:hypothetical protein
MDLGLDTTRVLGDGVVAFTAIMSFTPKGEDVYRSDSLGEGLL